MTNHQSTDLPFTTNAMQLLRDARSRKGLTQAAVARAIGATQASYARTEATTARLDTFANAAAALGYELIIELADYDSDISLIAIQASGVERLSYRRQGDLLAEAARQIIPAAGSISGSELAGRFTRVLTAPSASFEGSWTYRDDADEYDEEPYEEPYEEETEDDVESRPLPANLANRTATAELSGRGAPWRREVRKHVHHRLAQIASPAWRSQHHRALLRIALPHEIRAAEPKTAPVDRASITDALDIPEHSVSAVIEAMRLPLIASAVAEQPRVQRFMDVLDWLDAHPDRIDQLLTNAGYSASDT